jgi:hypothetical protein
MFQSQLAPVAPDKRTGAPGRVVNRALGGVLGSLQGAYALELGAGVVRHAWHMCFSRYNTLDLGRSASTMLETALRVDF